MSKPTVNKFFVVKIYSETQRCYFYLSDKDDHISWVSSKSDAKRFNIIESITMLMKNDNTIDAGFYEVETVIEKIF